jgi:hypothetical protein
MKILETYKILINEAHVEACVKSFGHELFGHELGGTEPNTPKEKSYIQLIHNFTDNEYGAEISPKFIQALDTLKGCMKEYPEILTPEKTKVYRGLTIPVKYFIDHKQTISLSEPMPYLYKAKGKIQSWSNSFDSAALFGNHDTLNEVAKKTSLAEYNTPEARKKLLQDVINEDLRIAFVLEYTTNPKEFIFKSKYFRVLSAAHHEDELIRIDNKPINVMVKFNDSEDVFLTRDAMMLIKYINAAILGK